MPRSAARSSRIALVVVDDRPATRAKLAHRLAPIANAPLNTIHMLAFDDDIEVAATVLSQSERLDENALLASAGSKSQQHLFAIAQRKSLSEAVTDMLVERGDREVVHSVVKNSGARFSDAGFRMLVKRSAGDDDLATVVGLRSDIPHPHFLLLLEKASSAVRARLVAENPQAGAAVGGVVAEVVGGIHSEARKVSPDFAAAQAEVERRNRIRRIGEAEFDRAHQAHHDVVEHAGLRLCKACGVADEEIGDAGEHFDAARISAAGERGLELVHYRKGLHALA
jgi:uncharacterized protein (DUF2336 family)